MARNDKGHFEVRGVSAKGKEEWVRFDIVQQNAISRQEAPTSTVADRSTTSGPLRTEEPSSAPATPTIEAPPGTTAGENMGFPSKWKSMATGTIRALRFETNYIYGEVLLPEAAARAGAFALLELKKDGDKYAGKVNFKLVRPDGGANCSFQMPIELTLVTPERIEGHSQQPPVNAKIDWATCSFTPAPVRLDFIWIPVK